MCFLFFIKKEGHNLLVPSRRCSRRKATITDKSYPKAASNFVFIYWYFFVGWSPVSVDRRPRISFLPSFLPSFCPQLDSSVDSISFLHTHTHIQRRRTCTVTRHDRLLDVSQSFARRHSLIWSPFSCHVELPPPPSSPPLVLVSY